MNNNKADIVCIQETHNINNNEIKHKNYNIYLSRADKNNENEKGIGGGSYYD